MPELAMMYAVGIGINLLLMATHLFLQNKKNQSTEYTTLQNNLHKAGFAWSDREGRLLKKQDHDAESDWKKQKKTIILVGLFCAFLSWPGLAMQFLTMLSIRFFARPRLEKVLWDSDLAKTNLSNDQVTNFLKERSLLVS